VTYLATEIVLYLLAAAFIGLLCGWVIWGFGRRKQFREIREDLASSLDSEMSAHQETRLALADADDRMKLAVEQAKKDAVRSLSELKPIIEQERKRADAAEAELSLVRGELDEVGRKGKAIDQKAIDEALRAANVEKAAAAEAVAREAQSRAQIEELRLLIGAEKLAAENARSELAQMRAGMQSELETERALHQKAKLALDDIRSTLAKTFGAEAANMVAGAASAQSDTTNRASGITLGQQGKASAVNMMTDIAAAGEALNNPDHDEADSEDREDLGLDLSPNIDLGAETTLNVEINQDADADDVQIRAVPDRVELRPVPGTPVALSRPTSLLSERPDDADDLQRIDGISEDIEKSLNAHGCYYFRQLADMAASDIDWLAQAINVTPYQIADDRWVHQAMKLSPDHDDPDSLTLIELSDRKNTG
jgi:predicted flap endonuclease-1-like 5' DNA nuclease/ribonuclease I